MATAESAGARRFLEVQESLQHAHSCVHPVVESVLRFMRCSGVSTQYHLQGVGVVHIHAGQTCKKSNARRRAWKPCPTRPLEGHWLRMGTGPRSVAASCGFLASSCLPCHGITVRAGHQLLWPTRILSSLGVRWEVFPGTPVGISSCGCVPLGPQVHPFSRQLSRCLLASGVSSVLS